MSAAATLTLAVLFWCCVGGIVYTYAIYPLLLAVLSRAFGAPPRAPADAPLPSIALIIAAHNEAAIIESRIANALALDYPADRLRIVLASDGSTDGTAELVGKYEPRVRVLHFKDRRGKPATLNDAVAACDAEIVAFSDANTFMDPASLRHLARWFADSTVGAVCGRLILTDSATGGNADGLYWRYETFLKRHESRLGALLGANGAIYAIRRGLYRPLPAGTVVDDFVVPLMARLQSRARIVYDESALAMEETPAALRDEFGRRARIGLGGWQALGTLWPLLLPAAGWTAFSLWSHKVLRWACPLLMLGALAFSALLWLLPLYRGLLAAQAIVYAAAALLHAFPGRGLWARRARLLPMFVGMNAALLVGLARWLRERPSGVWTRTARGHEQPAPTP